MKKEINISNEEYSEIVINNVNDYLAQISELRKQIEENEGLDAQQFFFRGQANIGWDVVPGVFRDNYLSSESVLIREAYLREPSAFETLHTDFEKLAKLQHYGLPTRLLDVTSNPLVALYFACIECKVEQSTDDNSFVDTDGVVLFKRAYGKGYNDIEIQIISYLANRGTDGGLSLSDLLNELVDKKIYSVKSAQACIEMNYRSLIEVLQNNYFVMSNMNNERLVRQSGLFLLTGKYNVNYQTKDVGNSIIQSAQSSAKTDFESTVFRIPSDNKKDILKELDFYNINEGSLFPELEHQMSYIKYCQSNRTSLDTGAFTEVDSSAQEDIINPLETKLVDDEIEKIIDEVVRRNVNPILQDDCKIAIMDNLSVDWYRRDVILSKIRLAIADALSKYNMSRIEGKQTANLIVNKILQEIENRINK